MVAEGLLNTTRKEFVDHLTSRKFLLLMTLVFVVCAVPFCQGIADYYDSFEAYAGNGNQDPSWVPPDDIFAKMAPVNGLYYFIPPYFSIVGAILAITFGFDLVTKEKETRSLKTLLSHPVYRDEIINGKALGGIIALAVFLGAMLLVSLSVLFILGFNPGFEEMIAVMAFGIVSLLYLALYFSLALTMSVLSNNSGKALIYSLIILFALSLFVPMAGDIVQDTIVGDRPNIRDITGPDPYLTYQKALPEWEMKYDSVDRVVILFSPERSYEKAAQILLYPRITMYQFDGSFNADLEGEDPGITGALGKVWQNILVLLLYPLVFFSIAYVAFMRMDVR